MQLIHDITINTPQKSTNQAKNLIHGSSRQPKKPKTTTLQTKSRGKSLQTPDPHALTHYTAQAVKPHQKPRRQEKALSPASLFCVKM